MQPTLVPKRVFALVGTERVEEHNERDAQIHK